MKKLLLVIAMVAAGFTANAQDGQTAKGTWLVEGNTGFGSAGHSAGTGFMLSSIDTPAGSTTIWNVGAEAGYFIMDDLAVKFGLGYGDLGGDDGQFSYKIGAKYYINSMIPVQIDYTGASIGDVNTSFLGLQAGYAIFLGDMVSIEPGLRYNLGLGDSEDVNVFELNIGFALHF